MAPVRRTVTILLCLVVEISYTTVRADRERVSDLDETLNDLLKDSSLKDLFDDPNLLLAIKKRIGSAVERDELDNCPMGRRKEGAIIKTHDSIERGAVFISSPPNVRNTDDCIRHCCLEESCNTAISKNKEGEIACYLFDCGRPNKCVFSPNPDFSVMQFTGVRPEHQNDEADPGQKHVNDLTGLLSTTVIPKITTTPTITTEFMPKSSPVEALAECLTNGDCHVANAECVGGYCACRVGYHAVGANCRVDCNSQFEFECANVNEPLLSECIAIYDRCDRSGIEQCKDGSDEIGCSRAKGRTSEATPSVQSATDKAIAEGTNMPVIVPTSVPAVSSDLRPAALSTNGHNETKRIQFPVDVTIKTDVYGKPILPSSAEPWSIPVNQGAVVALVLGILLTTILLAFVGCRMRHISRRSRKGRPLGSNEADYLINGMYL